MMKFYIIYKNIKLLSNWESQIIILKGGIIDICTKYVQYLYV